MQLPSRHSTFQGYLRHRIGSQSQMLILEDRGSVRGFCESEDPSTELALHNPEGPFSKAALLLALAFMQLV